MNRIARNRAVTMLVAWLFCAHIVRSQASEEIVIADELRTAFFERAPRALANEMSKAVAAWCSSKAKVVGSDSVGWLCASKNLAYFRGVYINGFRGPHGLVCENYDGDTFKYLGEDLVAESVADHFCVPVESDGSAYELVVGEAADGDA